jgi:hypothetical protein
MTAQELIPLKDSMKELKNTLFLVNGLHKDLSGERDFITIAVSQMTSCHQKLEELVKKLEPQPTLIQQVLQETIQKEIHHLSLQFATEIKNTFE